MGPLAFLGNLWRIELRSAQEGKSFQRRNVLEVLLCFWLS